MPTPLWQLLIKIHCREPGERLTCHECFAVMELLAEAVSLGVEAQRLERLARDHLAQCPDCRERLEALVERLADYPT